LSTPTLDGAQITILGTSSSHGGTVITAASTVTIGGIKITVTGDLHSCPIMGHGITPITASSTATVNSSGIVRTGDTAACGAAMLDP
jgi:uncharacterized Zn-binding protein involved in type VI secretion